MNAHPSSLSDRELLELAAKAADLDYRWQDAMSGGMFLADQRGVEWNPLEDDGDALRLAVKLKLHIDHHHTSGVTVWAFAKSAAFDFEEDMDDQAAATRRAIVRAAAFLAK